MATNAYLDSDYPPAAAAEADQEEEQGDKCNLFRCFCCWRKYCRPHVPRYASGRDVVNTRAPSIAKASAALPPGAGGLRLYGCYKQEPGFDGALIRSAADAQPQLPHRTFAVDLDTESLLSPPPPPLPFLHGNYSTVSAHGKLWAPSVVEVEGGPIGSVRLVMHRLELDDDTWSEAASVDMPSVNIYVSDCYLQGYAVIGDRFILVSLSNSTFFCFDCATGGTSVLALKPMSSYF